MNRARHASKPAAPATSNAARLFLLHLGFLFLTEPHQCDP